MLTQPPSTAMPDSAGRSYAQEASQYAKDNFMYLEKAMPKLPARAPTKGGQSRSVWCQAWDELLAFANCGTWHIDGTIDHWCSSRDCCKNFDLETSIARARSLVLRTILAHKPGALIMKKWTKLGPSIDWFVLARWFSNIVGTLWDRAFSQYAKDGLADPNNVLLLGELNWRKVRGSRVRIGRAFLLSQPYKTDVVALALAIEP